MRCRGNFVACHQGSTVESTKKVSHILCYCVSEFFHLHFSIDRIRIIISRCQCGKKMEHIVGILHEAKRKATKRV